MISMVLNIRDVPDKLVKRAKLLAIKQGSSLRQFVIDAIQTAVKAQKGGKQ